MNRTITSGKSASFPTFSTETAKLHVAGESIFDATGESASSITANEKVITVEKLLYAAQFVDNMEELKAHYDVRAALAAQAGASMGKQHDAFLLAAMGQGAGSTVTLNDGTTTDASVSGSSSILTTSALIKQMFNETSAAMDNNDVPAEGRCMVVRPFEYYSILQEDGAISSDFSTSGDRSKGLQNLHYLGFEVIPMTLMKEFYNQNQANQKAAGDPLYLGGVTANDDHTFDGSLWCALAFQKEAAGTVTLKGLQSEANYIPERFGTLMATSAGIGTGLLRPENVVKIVAAQA